MKTLLKFITVIMISSVFFAASCKKKETPPVNEPAPPPNTSEVITTFRIIFTDSATNAVSAYMFKDPDGEGGAAAFYGPGTTSSSTQADSVITLAANKTYYTRVVLLDETKSPVDSISNAVNEEGSEHMLFYNHGLNSVLNTSNPYTVLLNGSGIKITYSDIDSGSPQRGIGLKTKWKTYASTGTSKNKLVVTLRHQPGSKDGTFAPGETDIEVNFKLMIN